MRQVFTLSKRLASVSARDAWPEESERPSLVTYPDLDEAHFNEPTMLSFGADVEEMSLDARSKNGFGDTDRAIMMSLTRTHFTEQIEVGDTLERGDDVWDVIDIVRMDLQITIIARLHADNRA